MVFIVAVIVIVLIFYLWSYYELDARIVFGVRVTLSGLYLLLGMVAFVFGPNFMERFGVMILLGLGMHFFSDLILELRSINRRKKLYYLFMSLVVAAMGHLVYLIAFYPISSQKMLVYMLIGLGITAVLMVGAHYTKVQYKGMKWLIYMYTFISSTLYVTVLSTAITQDNLFLALAGVAVGSFLIADFFLSYVYFRSVESKTKRVLKRCNLALYYFAQTALALMIFYVVL